MWLLTVSLFPKQLCKQPVQREGMVYTWTQAGNDKEDAWKSPLPISTPLSLSWWEVETLYRWWSQPKDQSFWLSGFLILSRKNGYDADTDHYNREGHGQSWDSTKEWGRSNDRHRAWIDPSPVIIFAGYVKSEPRDHCLTNHTSVQTTNQPVNSEPVSLLK